MDPASNRPVSGTGFVGRRFGAVPGIWMLFLVTGLNLSATAEPLHPVLSITTSTYLAAAVTNIPESVYTNSFIPHGPPRNSTVVSPSFVPLVVANDKSWFWTNTAPNQITSLPSGIVFPNTNPLYQVYTQSVTVFSTTATNNLTRKIQVPYYKSAANPAQLSLVNAAIDYNKQLRFRNDLSKIAPAYVNSGATPQTRDDNYARRIAIALLDWARWHPKYYLTDGSTAIFINVTTNYLMPPSTTSAFGFCRASADHGLSGEFDFGSANVSDLRAFDAIYNSVALTNLSAEMGFDVRGYITTNLYYDGGDFIVNHVPVSVAILSNLTGTYSALPLVARVLDRPDYMNWMGAYNTATMVNNILRDGVLEQGTGYSYLYGLENQGILKNTLDYFLTRAATNSLLLSVSNNAQIYSNLFAYGLSQWRQMALPDGNLPSFGDAGGTATGVARNAGASWLLGAYGAVSMGGGSGTQAVQVNQSFAGNGTHMRTDTTAFTLYAFTNEILNNMGYFHIPGRSFGNQTLAHNLVTIDRVNASPFPAAAICGNGNLTLFEPGNGGFAVTELDAQRDFSDKASRYQRLLMLNTVDLTKPYVVDVLRVTGGTTHDYTLYGTTHFSQYWECSAPLATNNNLYPMLEGNETWVPPIDQYADYAFYGVWRGVCSNRAPGNFTVTYRDAARTAGRDLRLWMTDDGTASVYLGMTPYPTSDLTDFFAHWRPSALVRKRVSKGPLASLFVSVIEPMAGGRSNIVSVTRLPMSGATNESVGLQITFSDGRGDTCLINLRNPAVAGATNGAATVSTTNGGYSLTGRLGVQVDRPGSDSRVWTMNATDFQFAGRRFSTPASVYYSGLITGATRRQTGGSYDAFQTASPVPPGTALQGKWLSLRHGTLTNGISGVSEMFQIDRVYATNGFYSLCFTNDHFLEITNGVSSAEQIAPGRTFSTSNSFEIALSASAQLISPIASQIVASGKSLPVNFSFGNLGTTPGSALQVLATSSNQALIPNAALVISGSGTNRTLTVSSSSAMHGDAWITLLVTDGVWTNSSTFLVSVVVPPKIASFTRSVAGGFVFAGSGPTNLAYRILSATNLAQPPATWSVVTNGVFVNGLFSATLPKPQAGAKEFYLLSSP